MINISITEKSCVLTKDKNLQDKIRIYGNCNKVFVKFGKNTYTFPLVHPLSIDNCHFCFIVILLYLISLSLVDLKLNTLKVYV